MSSSVPTRCVIILGSVRFIFSTEASTSKKIEKSQVVILGLGPVGLTLALDLAQRNISVTVVETRYRMEPPSEKCNHASSGMMEILRRQGVSADLREAGLPDDYPHDVYLVRLLT